MRLGSTTVIKHTSPNNSDIDEFEYVSDSMQFVMVAYGNCFSIPELFRLINPCLCGTWIHGATCLWSFRMWLRLDGVLHEQSNTIKSLEFAKRFILIRTFAVRLNVCLCFMFSLVGVGKQCVVGHASATWLEQIAFRLASQFDSMLPGAGESLTNLCTLYWFGKGGEGGASAWPDQPSIRLSVNDGRLRVFG